jgi:uncharacterized protein (TIGR02246 family)
MSIPILSPSESGIRTLYEQLLDAWNQRNADDYAALFTADANLVGFDGSVIDGREAIQTHLSQIFADHQTATYVHKIREIRFLTPDSVLLRAVAGMIPPGQSELNPATNAIQSLVAVKQNGKWQITLFHNTPAQFHGKPELAEALTEELRSLVR